MKKTEKIDEARKIVEKKAPFTRNGTPFRSNGREYLLVGVNSHALLGKFEAMEDPKPQHFQFHVRWGKDKFGWCPS